MPTSPEEAAARYRHQAVNHAGEGDTTGHSFSQHSDASASAFSDSAEASRIVAALQGAALPPIMVPPSGMGAASMEHTSELMKLVADSLGHLRENTQESAGVALKQAAAVATIGDLLGQLFRAIEECVKFMKEAKLQKEDLTSLVNDLSRQVASDREELDGLDSKNQELQDYVREMEATLEAKDKALQDSRDQLKDLQEEHACDRRNAAQLRAMHLEVESQLDEVNEELRAERAQKEALKIAKQQLQSQLKHMVKAEKDLTKGLREAHEQIEEQMMQLRNEVAHEKSAKEALKTKKSSLAASVKELNSKVRSEQQTVEQLQAELQIQKASNAKLANDLKSERKAAKMSATNEKFYQDKCAELEAQLHRIQARAAMSASRRAHSAGPKKKGGKSKTAGENHASVTVVAVPHMGSPHNLSSSSIEEMMTRRVMDIIPVPQNLS